MPSSNLKGKFVQEEGFAEIEDFLTNIGKVLGEAIKEEGRPVTEEAVQMVKDNAPSRREVSLGKSEDIKRGIIPIIREGTDSFTYGIDSQHEETTQIEFGSSKSSGRVFFRIGLGHMMRNLASRIERNLAKKLGNIMDTKPDEATDVWVRTE